MGVEELKEKALNLPTNLTKEILNAFKSHVGQNEDLVYKKYLLKALKYKDNMTREDVLNILDMNEKEESDENVNFQCKVGDVFMHYIFKHPVILLKYSKKNGWLCGLLTSDENCDRILEKTQSRFFTQGFFTKHLFVETNPQKYTFVGVYDNNKHLSTVVKQLIKIFAPH